MVRTRLLTLSDTISAASGRSSGFDYLRLALAMLVVAVHSIDVAYGAVAGTEIASGLARPFVAAILPMFFALSGFLVAGSLERCRTLVSFAGLRVLRLAPALAVETLLAALLLGPLVTSLSLSDYFAHPDFAAYFLNILGHIQYVLPGVFDANPWARTVNAQLWTLQYELICYLSLICLAVLGAAQKRWVFLGLVVAANVGLGVLHAGDPGGSPVAAGPSLVLCFLYGNAAYLFRDRIVHSWRLLVASLAVMFGAYAVPGGDFIAPVAAVYATVFLGLLNPETPRVLRSGDYSYGIFLFGFPIQQAVAYWTGPAGWSWHVNFAIALPLTVAMAVASWHLVEKPALRLRPLLLRLETTLTRGKPIPATAAA
jgi:peptidoglycan/LPS O-acetylase OafA/YrhL